MLSSSDYRQIARKGTVDKAERLFRASISAYCWLTYPTRAEAQQLDDLTLPLYPSVSRDTLRYVAAALSESALQPSALVRRLCQEAVDICAPLLLRSNALTDIDLIALIARSGVAHARVIARRANLHPTLAALAARIERKQQATRSSSVPLQPVQPLAAVPNPVAPISPSTATPRNAEQTRDLLRAMMAAPARPELEPTEAYRRLRDAALSGSGKLLRAALADVLRIDDKNAAAIAQSAGYAQLLSALRSLDLSDERAFLITAASFPDQFPQPIAIRLFLERYGGLDADTARERMFSMRAEAVANTLHREKERQVRSAG